MFIRIIDFIPIALLVRINDFKLYRISPKIPDMKHFHVVDKKLFPFFIFHDNLKISEKRILYWVTLFMNDQFIFNAHDFETMSCIGTHSLKYRIWGFNVSGLPYSH
ncbi:MAG: hypothetical protein A2W25_08710 [candidate division Zixibacteria bacterium RBG_16_53_22]|nr:MAG: hypothetical protein A2W25_08710 [candidate division Zixibacteria bacterium RBG_16_53_22]